MSQPAPVKQFLALVVLVAALVVGAKVYGTNTTTPESTPTVLTSPASSDQNKEKSHMLIHTDKGDIALELYDQDAPKTAENFKQLAAKGYYNGVTFHRVEPGFVIQGGDPKGNGTGGESIYGETFEDELNPNTESYKTGYKRGVLAMANRGPNTNGSQFFIMLADNDDLPKNYTIFGRVTSGMDVVDKIAVGDVMREVKAQDK